MTSPQAFLLAEQIRDAVGRLGQYAAALGPDDLPAEVRQRLPMILTDLWGVAVAGMRTPELGRMVEAWSCAPGPVRPLGSAVGTTAETAAYLSAVAACCLELDEGNKHATGHPAAHVVFAAMAAARMRTTPVTGERFLAAVAAGYEVAARFGRATTMHPGWHTHGHWGATGAGCAAALLLDADAAQVAAAIDSATGLMHVAPWGAVLAGDFTRNLWLGGAGLAGLNAARLALAGLVHNQGTAAHTLGDLAGALDPDSLTADWGSRWLVAEGYLKRHSSCSYTHAAVDALLALRADRGWQAADVERIEVRSHSLAEPLLGRHPHNRLTAMFSLPFTVSVAAVRGQVQPEDMEPDTPAFRAAEAFSERVEVVLDPDLDAELPERRPAVVHVRLADGGTQSLGVPNPVGDADFLPFTAAEVAAKVRALVGEADALAIAEVVRGLPAATDTAALLATLP